MSETILVIASFPASLIKFRGPLIEAMIAHGCVVYVAAPELKVHCEVENKLGALGVRCVEISMSRTGKNPFRDVRTMIEVAKVIKKISPDVVLAYTVKPVIYGMLASRLMRVPRRFALITGLGYAFTEGRETKARAWTKRLTQFLYKQSLHFADKVFFQNKDDAALFSQLGLVSSRQRAVVLNGSGIDLVEFREDALPADTVSFLMIARLLGDKGVREYAEAAMRVMKAFPSVKFHLAGWLDDNPDSVEQHEVDRWQKHGIHFYGRLEDVRPAIKDCNVYVLPSYREGTPRTVLEAMSMGRPVITTDTPGCRETVIDGDNGFLVPAKTVDALVEAMTKFVQFPEIIPAMGARSRQIAEEKFDVHKVNAIMLVEMGIVV